MKVLVATAEISPSRWSAAPVLRIPVHVTAAPPRPPRLARAARVMLGSAVAIAVCAAMAFGTGLPWVFPSLGPTAFIAFLAPGSHVDHPRRVLLGHAIAIACGAAAVWLCGLHHAPPATEAGVDPARVLAVTLALAATGGLTVLLDAEHPPAGATTLIVALGLLRGPRDLALMEAAVLVLVLVCAALRRLGLDSPPVAVSSIRPNATSPR